MKNALELIGNMPRIRGDSYHPIAASIQLIMGHFLPEELERGLSSLRSHTRNRPKKARRGDDPSYEVMARLLKRHSTAVMQAIRGTAEHAEFRATLHSIGKLPIETESALDGRLNRVHDPLAARMLTVFREQLMDRGVPEGDARIIRYALSINRPSMVLGFALAAEHARRMDEASESQP